MITIIEAKKKAEKLRDLLLKLEVKVGKTDNSKKVIKLLNDFLKCNLKEKCIYERYEQVRRFINDYEKRNRE